MAQRMRARESKGAREEMEGGRGKTKREFREVCRQRLLTHHYCGLRPATTKHFLAGTQQLPFGADLLAALFWSLCGAPCSLRSQPFWRTLSSIVLQLPKYRPFFSTLYDRFLTSPAKPYIISHPFLVISFSFYIYHQVNANEYA